MSEPMATKVYKNEDMNNPEYATIEEVQRAFFGRGVFIKETNGTYYKVTGFGPKTGTLYAEYNYVLAKPSK